MKKYTELELKGILEKHSLWLREDPNGERANLAWTDLYGADLRMANLCRADLTGANLSKADLSGAILRKADFSGANLGKADLSGANLSGSNLSGADLREADLRWVDLSESILCRANLSGSNLSGSNLNGSNLSRANLHESKGVNYPMTCPEKGSFIGFKRVRNYLIVELEITEDSLRSSATGRKCRCSKAKVLSITNINGAESNTNSARSLWDPGFVYTVGETIEVPNFDTNRWNECAPGIHFFITRQEAVDFIM